MTLKFKYSHTTGAWSYRLSNADGVLLESKSFFDKDDCMDNAALVFDVQFEEGEARTSHGRGMNIEWPPVTLNEKCPECKCAKGHKINCKEGNKRAARAMKSAAARYKAMSPKEKLAARRELDRRLRA